MYRGILTGLGGRGLHWHNKLQGRKDAEIVAYVEPVPATRQRAVEKHAVPEKLIFGSLDEALQKVKADFVMDVTPPSVHHVVAEKTFQAGLHLLGEKPLSDHYATAVKVVEQGKKAGVKHMLTQNYRFAAFPRAARKLLVDGLIGEPGQCDIRFYMPWADFPNSHYVTQPYMLINDMMVHHFDLLRYMLGSEPVSVQAITWNHAWGWHKGDAAHAIVFTFAGGLHATHVSCGCAVGSRTCWHGDWRIEGAKGSLSWENEHLWHRHLHRMSGAAINEEIIPKPVPEAEQGILDEFFASIRENRQPECNAEDNLKSLAMVFGAIMSAKEDGKRINLSEL